MADINWSFAVSKAGGPGFSSSQSMTVEGYDEIDVKVAGKASGGGVVVKVGVQPSGKGKVKLLLITSDRYGPDLKYTATGGTKDIVLDVPQLLVGAGSIALLGSTSDLQTLEFTNELGVGNDANIKIIVGRTAIV
jgi:hypothetical protein